MAKNRMKKTELVVAYETAKGKCELQYPSYRGFGAWVVLFRGKRDEFEFHCAAMAYIMACLL